MKWQGLFPGSRNRLLKFSLEFSVESLEIRDMENTEGFGYRKLIAYQKAKEVVKRTYKLLKKFPKEEQYAMCDQLRRASISITSNIAEGMNRYSVKDKNHFLEMAYGSLMEVSSQFEIAEELGYINNADRQNMDVLIDEVARLISGLQKSFKNE